MIYTAITGNKDVLRNDVKCFTKSFGLDSNRLNAKIYKVLSHLFIEDEWSIWIDGNIKLKVSEKELIDLVQPNEVGVFKHHKRNCIYDEGYVCIKQNKDSDSIIKSQLNYYKTIEYPENNGFGFCGIIVRKNTNRIKELNFLWWKHIMKYSIRDQISFPVVFENDVKYLDYKGKLRNNYYFSKNKHFK